MIIKDVYSEIILRNGKSIKLKQQKNRLMVVNPSIALVLNDIYKFQYRMKIIKPTMKALSLFMLTIFFALSNNINAQQPNELVAGTHVRLTPPEGFVKAKNFMGYQKGEEAVINVMDLNGGNYYSNAASFKRETFEEKGIKVTDFKELKINGYEAKMAVLQGDANLLSVNVVFGDSTFSVMLTGTYSVLDNKLGEQIKTSLLSASYEKDIEVDPFANTFFSFNDSNSDLKFAQANANMFIYTIAGSMDNQLDKLTLIVVPVPKDNMTSLKQTSELMIEQFKGNGLTELEYISSSDDQVNGYNSYQTVVKGMMSGKKVNLLIKIIAKGDNQLLLQGIQSGETIDLDRFNELINTVKMN